MLHDALLQVAVPVVATGVGAAMQWLFTSRIVVAELKAGQAAMALEIAELKRRADLSQTVSQMQEQIREIKAEQRETADSVGEVRERLAGLEAGTAAANTKLDTILRRVKRRERRPQPLPEPGGKSGA